MRLLFWARWIHYRHLPARVPCACTAKIRRNDAEENPFCNHVSGCSFGQRDVSAPVEDSFRITGCMRKPMQSGDPLCKTMFLLSCVWGKVCDRNSAGGPITGLSSSALLAVGRWQVLPAASSSCVKTDFCQKPCYCFSAIRRAPPAFASRKAPRSSCPIGFGSTRKENLDDQESLLGRYVNGGTLCRRAFGPPTADAFPHYGHLRRHMHCHCDLRVALFYLSQRH